MDEGYIPSHEASIKRGPVVNPLALWRMGRTARLSTRYHAAARRRNVLPVVTHAGRAWCLESGGQVRCPSGLRINAPHRRIV